MHKRLILILLFLSPLLNSILISTSVECSLGEAFAQVIIKDEIVLEETEAEIDAVTLTMPFYGRVYSQIPCQWNHWTSGAIKITRSAGGQTDLSGCHNYVCGGGGWCACSVGTRALNFYNVPQGTEIFVGIQRCYDPPPNPPNNPSWHEVPLYFTYVGNNRYDLYGQDLSDQSWDFIGYFKFIEQQPPECTTAFCEYQPDSDYGFIFEHIIGPTYEIPGTNETVNACSLGIAGGQVGGMIMAPWHLPEGYTWNLYPCIDPNNPNYVIFPFTFTVDGIEREIVPYVYVTGICDPTRPDPLGDYLIIENFQNMKLLVNSGFITDHCNLLSDICHAYGSDPNKPGYQKLYKYVLQAVVDAHEEMHAEKYIETFNSMKDYFNSLLNQNKIPCYVYEAMDPEEAKEQAKQIYEAVFKSFISDIEIELDRQGRDQFEEKILTHEDQVRKIYPYYKWLYWDYMKTNHIQCATYEFCEDFLKAWDEIQ